MAHKSALFFGLLLTLLTFSFKGFSQSCGVIPTPRHVQFQSGFFNLDAHTQIFLTDTNSDNLFAISNFRNEVLQHHPEIKLDLCTSSKLMEKTGVKSKSPIRFIELYIVEKIPVDTFPEQAYLLTVTPQYVVIKAISATGLFYGLQSLKQLYRNNDTGGNVVPIPCMEIVDFPALQYRGWLDDISRGPVPNMDFYKKVISTYAEFKLNFFNFYTEHLFKLDSCPDIAPEDGLTAQQIKELEDFARPYHIEIFGNQQCLAHAEKTLRIPFYQEMADTKSNYNPGNPQTYRFLNYQLKTVANAYQSPFFNINCDETEGLGNGKARVYVDSVGAGYAYAQHIIKVYEILKKYNKRVMMWGDIAAKDTAIVNLLPKDLLLLVWSYSPSDSYEDMMLPFKRAGFDFMVAPGLSMWSTVYPSMDTYTKNIANMVRDGYRHGAMGMMNTAWDDSGESLFNSTWHGMTWGAEMSWNPILNMEPKLADAERNERLDIFNHNFEKQFLHYPVANIAQFLSQLEHTDIQDYFSFGTLFESVLDFYPSKVSSQSFIDNQKIYQQLKPFLNHFDMETKVADEHNAMIRIAHYVCLREQYVAERNMLRYYLYTYYQQQQHKDEFVKHTEMPMLKDHEQLGKAIRDKYLPDALHHLYLVKSAYMQLWDEENRPYSRDIVEARFNKAAQELLNVPYHVFISSKLNDIDQAVVTLQTLFQDCPIYYTLDGRTPHQGEITYQSPLTLSQSALVKTLTYNDMHEPVESQQYVLIHKALGKLSKLNIDYGSYRPQYAAGGKQALTDGILGGDSYADGTWQGYWGSDIDAVIDFGKVTTLQTFQTRFFQNCYDWIMAPKTVELYTSFDGVHFQLFKTLSVPNVDYKSGANGVYPLLASSLNMKTRYVRVVVKNAGPLPSWHHAAGNPSYLFADEFIFN